MRILRWLAKLFETLSLWISYIWCTGHWHWHWLGQQPLYAKQHYLFNRFGRSLLLPQLNCLSLNGFVAHHGNSDDDSFRRWRKQYGAQPMYKMCMSKAANRKTFGVTVPKYGCYLICIKRTQFHYNATRLAAIVRTKWLAWLDLMITFLPHVVVGIKAQRSVLSRAVREHKKQPHYLAQCANVASVG